MDIIHFEIKIKDKISNKINKEFYLNSKPAGDSGCDSKRYEKQILKANYNYDLNMRYFDSLDNEKFNKYLDKQIKINKFKECKNLKKLEGISGIYMLVLDEYKQVYIGKSKNIKNEVKAHWNKRKSLEKLIHGGNVLCSVLSIDSFGALNTTRIFYIETYDVDKLENNILTSFKREYILNRTLFGGAGSSETYTNDVASSKTAVSSKLNWRDFTKFIDIEKLKEIVGEELNYYIGRCPYIIK